MLQLMELHLVKEDDDEMIAQLLYAIYQLLLHEETRNLLLNETPLVTFLIDLLYDRNPEIRKFSDSCLDIISEISDPWFEKILEGKFHSHNSEWVSALAHSEDLDQIFEDSLVYSGHKEKRNVFYSSDVESERDMLEATI